MKQFQHVHHGPAIDFLKSVRAVSGLSEREAALVIAMGGAYLGKNRCKEPERTVTAGQVVSVYYRLPVMMNPIAFDPNWIVAQHKDFLVASKPAGMPTQGRRDADYSSFYELLKNHLEGYLGLHHRLDQDTSGLLVFTRNRAINKDFSRAFQERLLEKAYLAVASGAWPFPEKETVLDAPIGPRRCPGGTRHEVTRSGKPARTVVRLLGASQDFPGGPLNLLWIKPITGRTHQIRVHLSHTGLPLWGDRLYGGTPAPRFLLHCFSLTWPRLDRLPAGDFRQGVPEDWWQWLPQTLHAHYRAWGRTPC